MRGVSARLANGFLRADASRLTDRAREMARRPAVRRYFVSPTAAQRPAALAALRDGGSGPERLAGIELRDRSGRALLASGAFSSGIPLDSLLAGTGRPDSGIVGPLRALGDSSVYPVTLTVLADAGPVGYLVLWAYLSGIVQLNTANFSLGNRTGSYWTDLVRPVTAPPPSVLRDSGVVTYRRPAGGRYVGAVVAVPGTPWLALTEAPEPAILEPARSFLRRLLITSAGLLLVSLLLTWLVTRRITRPLGELTSAVGTLASGHFEGQVAERGRDEIGRLAAAFNDMTRRVEEGHRRLAEQAARYEVLFEGNPNPMWVFDRTTLRFLAVNEAAQQHYGYSREEFLALSLTEIRPPGEVPRLMRDLEQGHVGLDQSGTWLHQKKDGSVMLMEITSHQIDFVGRSGVLVLARDVTALRRLEQQYLQAQKMEAVGRLAGGVAHDFNNLLTVMAMECELALERLDASASAREPLDQVQKAVVQASGLTQQLLAFSRQQVLAPVVFELNGLVADVEKMLRRVLGEDIELVTTVRPEAGSVRADRGQLEQVLMNLAVNARDAMPEGGLLTVQTSEVLLDEGSPSGDVPPGRYSLLTVTDSGSGMTEEVRAHLFEPFFTTKEAGRGTGLGLATCYGIVKQAGGHIAVYSEVGVGTTFKVYLPRSSEAPAPPPPARKAVSSPHGSETILVVEDQDAVRGAVERILRKMGYRVLAAKDGEEALGLLNQHARTVDLLLTDVVLPGMKGGELAERARAMAPGLRVLFASGYTGDVVAYQKLVEQDVPLIQKPFSAAALGQRVREVLDRDPAT